MPTADQRLVNKHLCILLLLSSGCATAPLRERNTVRVHLYDIRQNNSSTGVDPKSIFVLAGNTVMPTPRLNIVLVPTRCKKYPAAREEEYYVYVDLSGVSRCSDPSRWDRNRTPSSVISRLFARLKT